MGGGMNGGAEGVRPLVVTADELVLDDVLRLAAAAGVEVIVATDAAAARPGWSTAPLVLIGPDVAATCAGAEFGRRAPVVLVSRCELDADDWRAALRAGAESVCVLPAGEPELVQRLGEAVERSATDGVVVGCIGGRGGAGASVLACALAVTAARSGRSALLVDLDPLGGGADLLLGAEDVPGLRWPELRAAAGRLPGAALRAALPQSAGVAVLAADRPLAAASPSADRSPRRGWVPVQAVAVASVASVGTMLADTGEDVHPGIPAEAAVAVLRAGARSGDVVVVDLPRSVSATGHAVTAALDLLVVVTPAEVRACAASGALVSELRPPAGRAGLVVRTPGPSRLDPALIAGCIGLPLLAAMRTEPGLAADLDRGDVPGGRTRGPLAACCRQLLARAVSGTVGTAVAA
jgi:Mrp family chromosome partitioning ATPase